MRAYPWSFLLSGVLGVSGWAWLGAALGKGSGGFDMADALVTLVDLVTGLAAVGVAVISAAALVVSYRVIKGMLFS